MNPMIAPLLLTVLLLVAPVASGQNASGSNPWSVQRSGSAEDDSDTLLLTSEARDPVRVGQRTVTPRLCVRQKVASFEAFIAFDTYLGHEAPKLVLRFDESPAERAEWERSGNSRAAVAPNPEGFVYRLFRHDQLEVQFTPPGESPVTIRFDLRQLADTLQDG